MGDAPTSSEPVTVIPLPVLDPVTNYEKVGCISLSCLTRLYSQHLCIAEGNDTDLDHVYVFRNTPQLHRIGEGTYGVVCEYTTHEWEGTGG